MTLGKINLEWITSNQTNLTEALDRKITELWMQDDCVMCKLVANGRKKCESLITPNFYPVIMFEIVGKLSLSDLSYCLYRI